MSTKIHAPMTLLLTCKRPSGSLVRFPVLCTCMRFVRYKGVLLLRCEHVEKVNYDFTDVSAISKDGSSVLFAPFSVVRVDDGRIQTILETCIK